jgi:hypothetical protein
MKRTPLLVNALVFGSLLLTGSLEAQIRNDAGFNTNTLARNDDSSTGLVALGFLATFFGPTYSQLYVNNNGNVTFTGPLGTFTPFSLTSTSIPIIAPFFADVDTRNLGSAEVKYGQATLNGMAAFGVNWLGVGYFNSRVDKLNSFQLVMIDRSDVGVGDFDFEFNYGSIQWETGDASGGSNGLGGSSARVGWSNGSTSDFELAGSAVNGAFINGGPNALNGLRYTFTVRNGQVINPPTSVPEPISIILLGSGLAGVALARRRRRQRDEE